MQRPLVQTVRRLQNLPQTILILPRLYVLVRSAACVSVVYNDSHEFNNIRIVFVSCPIDVLVRRFPNPGKWEMLHFT